MNGISFALTGELCSLLENPLEHSLRIWLDESPQEEREARTEIAQKIRDCYVNGSGVLDCRNSQITSLPSGLTALTELNCRGCPIASLPSGLTALRKLDCGGCRNLASLPSGLTALTELNCSDCPIASLPSGLTALSKLNCSSCRNLASLPSGLYSLRNLDCSNCQNLTSLPLDLANLDSCCVVNSEHCSFTQEAHDAFQAALSYARANSRGVYGPRWRTTAVVGGTISGQAALTAALNAMWSLELELDLQRPTRAVVGGTISGEAALSVDEELKAVRRLYRENHNRDMTLPKYSDTKEEADRQKAALSVFFKKMKNSADFRNPLTQKALLASMNQAFLATYQPGTFSENFWALIHESHDSCQDRAAITWNRIDVQRRLDTGSGDLQFFIGLRRLQLLHEEADKIVQAKGLGDAIEPMLYLQIQLKESLQLPTVAVDMSYARMAYISDAELEKIRQEILEKTKDPADFLVRSMELVYNELGVPVKRGDVSVSNPFAFDLASLWEKELAKDSRFNADLESIQPTDEEMNTDLHLTAFTQRKALLIQKWTRRKFGEMRFPTNPFEGTLFCFDRRSRLPD